MFIRLVPLTVEKQETVRFENQLRNEEGWLNASLLL
jgi:hypothetical protein